jgi:Protein of unknown function (DUF3386)
VSATDLTAEADLLTREAHDAAYRFPPGFAGFRCRLAVHAEGLEAEGRVTLRAGERPEVEIDLPENETGWLAHELGSLAGHRFHRSYEDADGRHRKRVHDEDGNPHGRLVTIEDAMDSSYRIGGGRINEITRTHGGSRFTIAIQQRADAPDGRAVSTAFTVCHWDAESGALLRADAYSDTHVELDGVLLPGRRRVATASSSGLTVREIELSGHELLAGEDAR